MGSDHKDLIVWHRSMELVKKLYALTKNFPREEQYGLTSQMRRAAVSVPSNLAEGHAMKTTPHFIKYIYTARGSLAELETQLIISRDLEYIAAKDFEPIHKQVNELSRMLGKMLFSLNKKIDLDRVYQEMQETANEC